MKRNNNWRFAAYIPVGPSSLDLERTADLLESLMTYEPHIAMVVLVDHGAVRRNFCSLIGRYPRKLIQVLRHHAQSDNGTWLGAGCVTNLIALDHVANSLDVDFVIKLDTDALVIGPFSASVVNAFGSDPKLGILGTLGDSCDKEKRTMSYDQSALMEVRFALHTAGKLRSNERLDNMHIVRWNLFTGKQTKQFLSICDEIAPIEANGFFGGHCQGGAYAVSRSFISRMRELGFLSNGLRWLWMPIAEDRMMGIYCSVVQLKLGDFSGVNQPFGVQAEGIAFSPEELILRGHSVIHSVRNNLDWPEAKLRKFYKERRLMFD
jgi:hypothetical protein